MRAFIGYGKSSLHAIVRHFAAEQGLTVKGDQSPDRGSFYRSDQFSFAKISVPAFYPSNGTEFIGRPEGWGKEQVEKWVQIHYHQPSDQLTNEWNFDGMIDNSRIGFFTALAVAQADGVPTWNPGETSSRPPANKRWRTPMGVDGRPASEISDILQKGRHATH